MKIKCNICGEYVSGLIDTLNGKPVCEKCYDENDTFEIPISCWNCGKDIKEGKYCSPKCEENANARMEKLNNLIGKADEILNNMKDEKNE